MHTVYVPADRFRAGLVADHGAAALAATEQHEGLLLELLDDDRDLLARVREKLAREPVEDLRIDFEDGYGSRPDDEEDADVRRAAGELRSAIDAGVAAPYNGIRFKGFEAPTRHRGVRTLALFLAALVQDGPLPDGFVVTLPKVTAVEQVEALVHTAGRLETSLGLADGAVRFELQVETPQSILGPDGTALVARMVHASGRSLHRPALRHLRLLRLLRHRRRPPEPRAPRRRPRQGDHAGRGRRHRRTSLRRVHQRAPGRRRRRCRGRVDNHLRLVRRSLERGFYQGWDLHPAQLPTRYAATFAFYREGFPAAAERLRTYVGRQESGILDEPATARALADFVLRGLDCGAVSRTRSAGDGAAGHPRAGGAGAAHRRRRQD